MGEASTWRAPPRRGRPSACGSPGRRSFPRETSALVWLLARVGRPVALGKRVRPQVTAHAVAVRNLAHAAAGRLLVGILLTALAEVVRGVVAGTLVGALLLAGGFALGLRVAHV